MAHHSRRIVGSWAIFVLTSLPADALVQAQAARVSGTIAVGTTKVAPQAVSAISYKAPNGQLTSVLVSDKAADRKEFLELTRVGPGEPLVSAIFEGAWKSLHFDKALSGFSFTVNSERRLLSNEFLVGGQDTVFSIPDDDLVLELTALGARATGRIRTKEAVLDLASQKVSLDVTFDVPVETR
jgi:hypothetical protein